MTDLPPGSLPKREGETGSDVYTVGEWNGLPQWQCRHCAWDTLDGVQAVMQHYVDRHVEAVPPKPVVVQLYDRWGNPQ